MFWSRVSKDGSCIGMDMRKSLLKLKRKISGCLDCCLRYRPYDRFHFSLAGAAAAEQNAFTSTLDENDIAIAQNGVLVMQTRLLRVLAATGVEGRWMELMAKVCRMGIAHPTCRQQLDPTTTSQDTSFEIFEDDDHKSLLKLGRESA